jgi:hypothetical protein
MKIEKIKIKDVDLTKYKNQNTVRRSKEIKGGYEKIVFASDQDLD